MLSIVEKIPIQTKILTLGNFINLMGTWSHNTSSKIFSIIKGVEGLEDSKQKLFQEKGLRKGV